MERVAPAGPMHLLLDSCDVLPGHAALGLLHFWFEMGDEDAAVVTCECVEHFFCACVSY
jgi:hypothetical protein